MRSQTAPIAVISDFHGVVSNLQRIRLRAWLEASRRLGFPQVSAEDFIPAFGTNWDKEGRARIIEKLGRRFPVDEALQLRQQLADTTIQRDGVAIKEGVAKFLEELHALAIPVGLGTSSSRASLDRQLERCQLSTAFAAVVCGDEVSRAKPSGEIFRRVAQLLDVSPSNCIVLEDSEAGIEAAHDAGMTPVHIKDVASITRSIREKSAYSATNIAEVLPWLRQRFRL